MMEKEILIDNMRKAVACKNEPWQTCKDKSCSNCKYDFPMQIIDLVESALPLLEQDRWIPVTERLPEKDCRCRVTEGDFKFVIDCNWNNHKKRFEAWSYYDDGYIPITNVTAWKPIEEPYTEEEA